MKDRLRRRHLLILTLTLLFTLGSCSVSFAEERKPEADPVTETNAGEEETDAALDHPEAPPETVGEESEAASTEEVSEAESGEEMTEGQTEGQELPVDEELESLLSQIRGLLPGSNGEWAVYVSDLVKGTESAIDDRRMQAASLIKLYIMGAVYVSYEDLAAQYDPASLDSWLYSMITVSDNEAANQLVSCLGGGDTDAGMAAVNEFCMNHGYFQSHMGRLLLHSNEYDDNYTSVNDCGHFLQEIYYENVEEYPYADAMYSLLKAQQRRNKIPAQMPEGVSVANKTGELDDVENDAGILYDSANDLVIVFMSENLSDVGSAQSTIASLSRQIYDYYCG